MLYEIISPDAFLRDYMDDYATLAAIYTVVRNAYAKRVQVDRAVERKTNEMVRQHIGADKLAPVTDLTALDDETIELIKRQQGGDSVKVINLVKSIERLAEEQSNDPFLVAMAERARVVQESFETRQRDTSEALNELLHQIELDQRRKQLQAERGLNSATFFILTTLDEAGISGSDDVSKQIGAAFVRHPNWRRSERDLREVRREITVALVLAMEDDDFGKATSLVETLIAGLGANGGER
jgi:type I restriction enzyme R subunit